MESMEKQAKVHEITHGALQENECKVCECVMKFNNIGKDHKVWNHSKVPRHQNSNESANMEHFAAQKSQNIWCKWQRWQQDWSQTESGKISDELRIVQELHNQK